MRGRTGTPQLQKMIERGKVVGSVYGRSGFTENQTPSGTPVGIRLDARPAGPSEPLLDSRSRVSARDCRNPASGDRRSISCSNPRPWGQWQPTGYFIAGLAKERDYGTKKGDGWECTLARSAVVSSTAVPPEQSIFVSELAATRGRKLRGAELWCLHTRGRNVRSLGESRFICGNRPKTIDLKRCSETTRLPLATS